MRLKPFVHSSGKRVVDEMCRCGHLLTEHGSQKGEPKGPGHGNCCALGTDCDCSKFRWVGWVSAEELIAYHRSRRKENHSELTV